MTRLDQGNPESDSNSNQLGPLDESQDRGNFLIDVALLHRSVEKNNDIGMPSTTATDGLSLSLSVLEVVENFGLEAKNVGITSDGGGNLRVCREALESKYTNDSVFPQPRTYSPWSVLRIYYQGIARRVCNQSSQMVVKLTSSGC